MHVFRSPLLAFALAALTLSACDSYDETSADASDASADVATTADASADAARGGRGRSGSVFATSNPPGAANDAIVRLSNALDLQATFTGFDARVTSVQNITFGSNGSAFVTVDLAPMTGGILVVDNLCGRGRAGACNSTSGTVGSGSRLIGGAATGLIAPKGLTLARGLIIVADNGAPGALRVFRQDATGNAAPEFVVTNTGGANVWDVAYDNSRDRLFVAATNGTVLVYDRFLRDRGVAGPTRVITPTDGTVKITVNLHGVAFDDRTRTLVITDIGAAAGAGAAGDGQLLTIANGDTASGNVAVRYRVAGAATQLGNPVDLVLDGGDALVAEKENSLVLRFENVLAATGTDATAADDSVPVTKAESVALPSGGGYGGNGRK